MDYFRRLGALLDAGWRDALRDEERFPDVAARALADLPPSEHFDREAFLDAVLDPQAPALRQLAPVGAFGQPGMTVHHGDGFVIEVYYWLNSHAAIHNHPFCGAFTILEGFSVHARYAVRELERVGSRARLVEASLDELRLLGEGHVERFSLRDHPLVHALVHVPVPSISMVLRTVRTAGYVRYLPPSVAVPMEQAEEPCARRLALLASLGAAEDPRYGERLARELVAADFETGVRILSEGWGAWDEETQESVLDVLRERHGASVDAIPAALDRAVRIGEATAVRERLRDPDLRLVAIALAYGDSRRRVLDLLAERGEPVEMLHRFVDEADLFEPDEAATALIAHALIAGEGGAGALRRLAEEFGEDAVAPHEEDVARYCESSLFSVLTR